MSSRLRVFDLKYDQPTLLYFLTKANFYMHLVLVECKFWSLVVFGNLFMFVYMNEYRQCNHYVPYEYVICLSRVVSVQGWGTHIVRQRWILLTSSPLPKPARKSNRCWEVQWKRVSKNTNSHRNVQGFLNSLVSVCVCVPAYRCIGCHASEGSEGLLQQLWPDKPQY